MAYLLNQDKGAHTGACLVSSAGLDLLAFLYSFTLITHSISFCIKANRIDQKMPRPRMTALAMTPQAKAKANKLLASLGAQAEMGAPKAVLSWWSASHWP